MRRSYPISLFCVLGLIFSVLLSSCGGSESAAPIAGGTGVTDIKVYEDSPYLALDGSQDQILMFNMDLTRRLTFFNKLRDAVFSDDERKSWLSDLEKNLGFNPVKEVDRMVIAMKEPFDREDWLKNAVIIMVCNYGSPETFAKGFVQFANGRYISTTEPPMPTDYRNVPIYSMMGSTSLENPDATLDYHLAFPGKRMVLFSRRMDMIIPVLDVMIGGAPNLQSKPAWQRRLSGARFSSVALGMGMIPKSIQEWLQDKSKTDPDYNGLIFIGDGREFYFSLAYTGRDYEISAAIRCDDISRAQGLRSNLDEFRKRGLDAKVITEWTGQNEARASVVKQLVDEITISIQAESATLDLKKGTSEMDRFVDDLINPPVATPAAQPQAQSPAPAPAGAANDPFSE